jgi:hypothetical protein
MAVYTPRHHANDDVKNVGAEQRSKASKKKTREGSSILEQSRADGY